MVDSEQKGLTPEERAKIIDGVKSLGKLSGIIALLLIYTPKRIFGLFGSLARLLSLKTVIAYEKVKDLVNQNGSKAIKMFSKVYKRIQKLLWRWTKISLIVLGVYGFLTIIGLILENSILIALTGIVTAIYFLIVCYILEKGIMVIASSYDFGKELFLDILHIPKLTLENMGINFREHQNIISEDRIRDAFRDLRFASVIIANVSFLLALFPYWQWVGILIVVGIGALGLALLHFWDPSWKPTFWTWFRRLSTTSLVILVLIFGLKNMALYFYPETAKAFIIAQARYDKDLAKQIKEGKKKNITKKVMPVVVPKPVVTKMIKPKVIPIPVSRTPIRPVVRQVVIPQKITTKVIDLTDERLREAALEAQKVKERMEEEIAKLNNVIIKKPKKKKIKVVIHDNSLKLVSNVKPRIIAIPR